MSDMKKLFEAKPRPASFHPVKYGQLPSQAKETWDDQWRSWADGSPDTCDAEERDAIYAALKNNKDPATSMGDDDDRIWATDGIRVAMYQSGAVLRGGNILLWFDGSKWFANEDSAVDHESVTVVDWDDWQQYVNKIVAALNDAYPNMGFEVE